MGVASPAVEAAPEGEIFGKGVQVFTIAGPVILYGCVCKLAIRINLLADASYLKENSSDSGCNLL